MPRSPRARLVAAAAVVFAVALALRVGHLAALDAAFDGTALFSMSRGDAAIHTREAREILGGNPWLADRIPWKPPGYSYFLAGLMALCGPSPGALRWPHALLGALNCALLVVLARRFLPVGWSFAAGLVAAANGTAILYDCELFQPTLLVSLSLPALGLLTRPGVGVAGRSIAGFLLGLAAVVHPAYLFPAALLAMWIARRALGHAVLFVLAVALPIAPLAAKNFFVHGQPVLISWNGGINLYVGNQPNFDAWSGNRTNAWGRIVQTPIDAGLEHEHERDRLYRRLAVRQFTRHPLLGSWVLVRKAAAVLSPVEYASNIQLYELREHSPVLRAALGRWGPLWWPFGVLAPLMLLGLWASRKRWSAADAAVALWSAGLAASMVLFFVNARYRVPVVFVGSIWVAGGLAELAEVGRAGGRALARSVALVLLSGAGIAALAVPQRGLPLPLAWDEASSLVAAGRFEAAEAWIQRALARAGDDPALRHAVAAFYFDWGRRDREREQLQAMLDLPDLEPDLIHLGHEALARSYMVDRRWEDARREIEVALAVGIDETDWHGHPHFQLGLGPLAGCWSRLLAAEIEARAGAVARARELAAAVQRDCGEGGRLGPRLLDLEVLCVRMPNNPP